MDVRMLVARKADVTNLAGLTGILECLHGAAVREDPVGALKANHFVMLQKVNVIDAQPVE